MRINLLRKLDYWAGVPMCFLFKMVDCVFNLFFLEKRKNSPDKLLLIKLSERGAIILTLPLILKILKDKDKSKVFFLTFEENLPLFELLDVLPIENVLRIRAQSLPLVFMDTVNVIRKMRKEKIETAVDLEFFSRFTAIITYLSGAVKRVGFYGYGLEGLYRGNLLTHKIQYNPLLHMSKMYISVTEVIGLERKNTPCLIEKIREEDIFLPRVNFLAEDRERLLDEMKGFDSDNRLFIIHPGEDILLLREWPLENYAVLAKMILENKKNYVGIVGTKDSLNKSNRLFRQINSERCFNLSGKTSIRELIAVFELADALIVHDCGTAHLASLTSIKKFVMFGPESPEIFKPLGENTYIIHADLLCSPCFSVLNHRVSFCRDNKCLKRISPQEVYRVIRDKMSV